MKNFIFCAVLIRLTYSLTRRGNFQLWQNFQKGEDQRGEFLGVIDVFLVISLIPHIILHRKFFTA